MGSREGSIMRNFIFCNFRGNIIRMIKSRRLRSAEHVARKEEGRSRFNILKGKPTAKSPLGRPRRRWEENIRDDDKEIGVNTRNSVH